MSEKLLSLLSRTIEQYQGYARGVSRPALKQFIATIIESEQRHLEELKDAGIDDPSAESAAGEEPDVASQDDLSGLRSVHRRIGFLENLFLTASSLAEDEDAGILFRQFADDETRMRKLVEDRLELEALI